MRREASEGAAAAQFRMGNLSDPMVNKAKATRERTREAIDWYRKAALQHVIAAESNLGFLLASASFGLPPDYDEARYWLARVAPVDLVAMRSLALLYRDGHGVDVNLEKANGLLRTAAERGDATAETVLAKSYEEGSEGLVKSPKDAVRFYALAAMQSYAFAERKLAEHLESGDGIPADPLAAAQWYSRAAAGGDEMARNKIFRTDPTAQFRSPKWGAVPQTIVVPAGNDASAERARCLALRARELPDSMARELPPSLEEQKRQSDRLFDQYPRNPRVQYARASLLYDEDHSDVAKVNLECAIDDHTTWYRYPGIAPYVFALLARIDMEAGDPVAAKATIAPVCASRVDSLRALGVDTGLCR